MITIRRVKLILMMLLVAVSCAAVERDTNVCAVRIVAVNYDPILREHGGVRLSRFMKWNDPHVMTTNLMRYLRECSGGYADYRLVDFLYLGGGAPEGGGVCLYGGNLFVKGGGAEKGGQPAQASGGPAL